ncbi:hypothetical protein D3C76_1112350 [compost metagenome]
MPESTKTFMPCCCTSNPREAMSTRLSWSGCIHCAHLMRGVCPNRMPPSSFRRGPANVEMVRFTALNPWYNRSGLQLMASSDFHTYPSGVGLVIRACGR